MLTEIEVRQIRELAEAHNSIKSIARQTHKSRNTIRRYLRGEAPGGRSLSESMMWLSDNYAAVREKFLSDGGNCAVVQRDLEAAIGRKIHLRQIQRFCQPLRQQEKEVKAFCRYETAPGQQMQIDFGEKDVMMNGRPLRIHFFVAVLGFSRRIFGKAFIRENQAAWLDGIESAFLYFGGVPAVLLSDNSKCLVTEHEKKGSVQLTEGYLHFCRQWAIKPVASTPHHPQSKGKVERSVRYVKENALAGRQFSTLQELNQWLTEWSRKYADDRRLDDFLKSVRTPRERFAIERKCLRPVLGHPRVAGIREETRKVDGAGLVRIDGNAYRLAKGLAHKEVQLLVDDSSIVVSWKGRFVIKLDKAESVYMPDLQEDEDPCTNSIQLPSADRGLNQNHLLRSLESYSSLAGGSWP